MDPVTLITTILTTLTAAWFLLSLVSALADAGVGYVDEWLLRRLNQRNDPTIDAPGRLVLISGFFGFITSAGATLFILASGATYSFTVPLSSFLQAFAAGILEVIWLIPYFYALNRGGAVSTTPLFQTVPIFSLLFGILFFAEIPVLAHIIATLIIVCGAALLNYSPTTKRLDTRSLTLMLLSSSIISIGFFLFKDAALSGNFVMSVLGNGLGMGSLSVLIWFCWRPYREQFNAFVAHADWPLVWLQFGNEALYTLGAITSQLALVLGPSVMVVSAMNAFHPVFTLLIAATLALAGSTVHKQALSKEQWPLKTFGIIAIAVGTVLIAL